MGRPVWHKHGAPGRPFGGRRTLAGIGSVARMSDSGTGSMPSILLGTVRDLTDAEGRQDGPDDADDALDRGEITGR